MLKLSNTERYGNFVYNQTGTPSTELPVSLEDMKSYLKVSTTANDDLITSLIQTASDCFEAMAGIVLIEKEFTTKRDVFDCYKLRRRPLQSDTVVIKYLDTDSAEQTVSSADYYFYEENVYTNIVFKSDFSYPAIDDRLQAISIVFTAGYGATSEDIPADIQTAIKQHVAAMYENRGDCADATCSNLLPATSKLIIMKYKPVEVGA